MTYVYISAHISTQRPTKATNTRTHTNTLQDASKYSGVKYSVHAL